MDVIRHSDGSTLHCYRVGSTGPGVVLLHAWWGLNQDMIALADRLASQGFRVAAPDLFDGRTAATPQEAEKLAEIGNAKWLRLAGDVERVLSHLRGEGIPKVGAVGLSFGAPYAVMAAAKGTVDAVVLFYGAADLEPDDHIEAPVLGHFADDDPYEPDGGQGLFNQLRAMGTPVEYHQYPGTYHWFFEPSNAHYQKDAADIAWVRTLEFLKRHLG